MGGLLIAITNVHISMCFINFASCILSIKNKIKTYNGK